MCKLGGRDHNATSYSTETAQCEDFFVWSLYAEIITLRAIALKPRGVRTFLYGAYMQRS